MMHEESTGMQSSRFFPFLFHQYLYRTCIVCCQVARAVLLLMDAQELYREIHALVMLLIGSYISVTAWNLASKEVISLFRALVTPVSCGLRLCRTL
jgi:hypothetical protein